MIDMLFADDYGKVDSEMGRVFLWTNPWYWTPFQAYIWRWQRSFLEKNGGPFEVEASSIVTPA
jgi:hypothetical protein